MTSAINDMYKRLEDCVDSLEKDVRKSLDNVTGENFDKTVAALETSKDFHYQEILSQLKQIKDRIQVIAEHNRSLQLLQKKINGTRIDRNYIKRQVEVFQRMGMVNRRERKPVRHPETSSMKLLESWEKLIEEQETNSNLGNFLSVPKRTNYVRKNKKVISSTVDTLLESSKAKSLSLDVLVEESVKGKDLPVLTKCMSSDSLALRKFRDAEAVNEAVIEVPSEEKFRAKSQSFSSSSDKNTSHQKLQSITKSVSSDALNTKTTVKNEIPVTKQVIPKVVVDTHDKSPVDTKPRIVQVIVSLPLPQSLFIALFSVQKKLQRSHSNPESLVTRYHLSQTSDYLSSGPNHQSQQSTRKNMTMPQTHMRFYREDIFDVLLIR